MEESKDFDTFIKNIVSINGNQYIDYEVSGEK
jgi:hypothetical protein